jgi:hypothetical protein
MSRSLVALLEGKLVQHNVGVTRPTLVGDGVDISSWRTNAVYSGPIAAVFLDGDQALTLAAPTGGDSGPELWGYGLGQWWRIGYVNDGADVSIAGVSQGFVQAVNVIGIFDRLCLCGTPSVGAVVAKFAPIDDWRTP